YYNSKNAFHSFGWRFFFACCSQKIQGSAVPVSLRNLRPSQVKKLSYFSPESIKTFHNEIPFQGDPCAFVPRIFFPSGRSPRSNPQQSTRFCGIHEPQRQPPPGSLRSPRTGLLAE